MAGALALAVACNGGAGAAQWWLSSAALCLGGAAFWLFHPVSGRAPAPSGALLAAALALPCFAALQTVPLPLSVLRVISPQTAAVVNSTESVLPATAFAPLSLAPAASIQHFARMAACLMVFLLIRALVWRRPDRPWRPVLPIVVLAVLEAVLGLAQFYSGAPLAHGTYVNRNHYAGFLEMALPFACLYPMVVLHRLRSSSHFPLRPALLACCGLGAALLILLAVFYSLSRMGFAAALLVVFLCTAGGMKCLWRGASRVAIRRALVAGCLMLVALGFLLLAPSGLISRFGEVSKGDAGDARDRLALWKETMPLIAAYPLFGCGLGSYESAFMRYKISGPTITDDFAHNDYLQYLAELGAVGFAIAAVLFLAVAGATIHAIRRHSNPEGRLLALACAASLAAIFLHSTVDFNLYIPANALCLAWICGIATSTTFSSVDERTARGNVFED